MVKIKEMGLRDGHPEKEGILVSLDDMVGEVKSRLQRKKDVEGLAQQAEGLKVIHGIKSDDDVPVATEGGETTTTTTQ
jgi:histidyl-tRNA synthetase